MLSETLTPHKGETGLDPCEGSLDDGTDNDDHEVEFEEAGELCSLACRQ